MLGIIRVLTTDCKKVLNEHGRIMSDYLHVQSETKCIDHQPRGIYDANSEEIAIPKIIQLAKEMAESGQFKALTISCAADPALEEVRREVRLPVLGAGSIGAHSAMMVGRRVGVIGITDTVPENIKVVLGQHFHSYVSQPTLKDTVSLFSDDAKEKLLETMQALESEGVDVILFACTGFSTINLKAYAKQKLRVPIIDLVEAQAVAYNLIK